MARTLRKNVTVGRATYGPDYPGNKVTAEVEKQIAGLDVWEGSDDQPEVDQATLAGQGQYEQMTHDGLQEELRRRNEAGADLKVTGKKDELIARLREHDDAE